MAQEDWTEMARPAFSSPNHVKSLERWRRKALEANPSLTDAQADRMAEHLRREFYAHLGRVSGASRRAARSAGRKIAAAVKDALPPEPAA